MYVIYLEEQTMERWYVMMKKADFSSIGAKYNISPVIARLIRNRDIIEDEEINLYLNGTIADLYYRIQRVCDVTNALVQTGHLCDTTSVICDRTVCINGYCTSCCGKHTYGCKCDTVYTSHHESHDNCNCDQNNR